MQPTLAVAVVAGLFLASTARAGDPNEILARAKAAAGGPACDAIRTLHLKTKFRAGGLNGKDELQPFAQGFIYPNGIALSGGDTELFVADGQAGLTLVERSTGRNMHFHTRKASVPRRSSTTS
jgi:hypothetical protein